MNSPEIKEFIKEHGYLFWWVPEKDKENLSPRSLVEAILNYGNEKDVKKLFELLGINTVAEIFYRYTAGPRSNYFPRTKHFFTLYFKRHASGNIN
jgi:hypothetical protein